MSEEELKKLVETLHPLERKVIPSLKTYEDFEKIVDDCKLKDIEVMRALQWMSNKKIIDLTEEIKEVVELDVNGFDYLKEGFPEKRFLELVKSKDMSLEDIRKSKKIDGGEINICIGTLKKKAAINFEKGMVSITEPGKKFLAKKSLEEEFITKKFPIELKDLKAEEKFGYDNLKKRKQIIKTTITKIRTAKLTALGRKISLMDLGGSFVDKLTPAMIKSGKWKNATFRKYDVKAKVPQIHGGKRHFVNQAVDYIKKIWLELGFTEMSGNIVQTSFWDLDSLFVPQDHPARQMQDTFYIKDPVNGTLPPVAKKVKAAHENGGDTGSKGWGGKWSKEEAKKNMLRTHTTVLSAQTIAALKKGDMPGKFFSVGKVFRNEALDHKHLFEFHQVEGIVVDPDTNLKNHKGFLKEFFMKMGFTDVRMRPAHFPYTEPSMEVDVYHPIKKEWIELGGSGIFRPEVTKPLIGSEVPVLAWGLGLERIICEYWGIQDLRGLYNNDLKKINEMNYWMKDAYSYTK